ncbi:pyruvate dehydrogenase complex E1 component subunit beta [Pontibacter sp. G13]|uniref:pyruvate dehydrogenase complex E1 component subunit beta n=1 Tax=Pontibacter sp. G13 TaxID=3074898 RepID=UPI00288AD002|nr:pyruvate dehydrogenase complex E1 component subunit beta [Pontibacter sp. G13]WNJ21008.1 pyruvate dehydrogenase complex E1 component subunit beta [Pontibacter sp. G13]
MREIQFREALREAMVEEMRLDDRIYLMGEEVAEYNGAYKVSQGMLEEFGEKRVIDTPISELGFAGVGVGSAMVGLRPIIEFMTFNFSLVAIDQVINNAAKIYNMSGGQYHCPIVFRGPSGSAGQLAATHSQSLENWYANCPGLKVVTPSTPADGKGLLKSAIRDENPVLVMESEVMYGDKGAVPEGPEFLIPLDKAEVKREGTDVTICSFGKMVHVAMDACNELAKEGINAEMIDLRSLRPIDYDTIIESVKKTNRCVFVEESWPLAAFAGEVTYMLQRKAFDYLDAPVVRVTGRDTPLPFSAPLVDAFLPSTKRIMEAVKTVMYRN